MNTNEFFPLGTILTNYSIRFELLSGLISFKQGGTRVKPASYTLAFKAISTRPRYWLTNSNSNWTFIAPNLCKYHSLGRNNQKQYPRNLACPYSIVYVYRKWSITYMDFVRTKRFKKAMSSQKGQVIGFLSFLAACPDVVLFSSASMSAFFLYTVRRFSHIFFASCTKITTCTD